MHVFNVWCVFHNLSAAVQHLLHHGRRGEGGRLRPGDGHGPGGGRGLAQRPDAGTASDPTHGPGGHQALHESRAGEQTLQTSAEMYMKQTSFWNVSGSLLTALGELVLSQSGHLLSGSDIVWAAVSFQDSDGESEGKSAHALTCYYLIIVSIELLAAANTFNSALWHVDTECASIFSVYCTMFCCMIQN